MNFMNDFTEFTAQVAAMGLVIESHIKPIALVTILCEIASVEDDTQLSDGLKALDPMQKADWVKRAVWVNDNDRLLKNFFQWRPSCSSGRFQFLQWLLSLYGMPLIKVKEDKRTYYKFDVPAFDKYYAKHKTIFEEKRQ